MMQFEQVISLGRNCQTTYQMHRYFGRKVCPSGIFDRQTTPPDALLEYLARDFRGLFEREDLAMGEIKVEHIHLGTGHRHSFPNGIDADYPTARSRHDYLCSKTRCVIHGRTSTLFVLHTISDTSDAPGRISRAISRLNPRLRFHILAVPDEQQPEPTRPFPDDWQGNDDYWSAAFAPIEIAAPVQLSEAPIGFAKQQVRRLMGHIHTRRF